MRHQSVEKLVYECMLPRPKPSDPYNFHGILTRFLVFEVRQEVHSFYGHLDTQEAKYPGLDYSNRIHRIRLSRWPWHRRLFRAFDTLRLTPAEISSLTKWEGTKWAKERYEKEQQTVIHDSAGDDMPDYRAPGSRCWNISKTTTGEHAVSLHHNCESLVQQPPMPPLQSVPSPAPAPASHGDLILQEAPISINFDDIMDDSEQNNMDELDYGEGDDVVGQSIGLQLNERLRERVAVHNAGDTSQPLDEDWEQWLKNAIEAGNWNVVAEHMSRIAALPSLHHSFSVSVSGSNGHSLAGSALETEPGSGSSPLEILNAARRGNWDDVPEFLQGVLRQTADANRRRVDSAAPRPSTESAPMNSASQHSTLPTWRRYSGLRLPGR